MSETTGLFDIDENNDWMPSDSTNEAWDDEYYELDENGDIQPK